MLVCIVALYFSLGWQTAISFLLGALCSGIAGFIGMYSATKANVRTAVAARDKGPSEALNIAFFGGSIMGLTVAAMGLFGVGILFYFLQVISIQFMQLKVLQWELLQLLCFQE